MAGLDKGREWLEQQLPGLEDSPLWKDFALIISVPLDVRAGLTNNVTVRRLDHVNYLDFDRRTCVLDMNTGISMSALPGLLESAIEDYQQEVFGQLHPFI